jgi:Plavaka transposase
MFVPIILGSDKTTVSVGTGNTEYWPVYGSIRNIHNNVRRTHRNGVVLLGFLTTPKSKLTFSIMIALTHWLHVYIADKRYSDNMSF